MKRLLSVSGDVLCAQGRPPGKTASFHACLCVALVCSLIFSGCTTVRTRYHQGDGETADLKVACYWRSLSGERHFVGGLSVAVVPVGFQGGEFPQGVTNHAHPLYLPCLPPGKYNLIITEGSKEYVSEKITLRPGKELSVRVKAHGRATGKMAVNVAEGLGQAFVVVVGMAVLVGVIYLDLRYDEHDSCRYHR